MERAKARPVRGKVAAQILRQNAMPFLLQLAEMEGARTPTAIVRAIGAETKYATATANRLRRSGLVDSVPGEIVAGKPTQKVKLSSRGRDVVGLLGPLVDFLERPMRKR